jgi:uncharacterized membrane protein
VNVRIFSIAALFSLPIAALAQTYTVTDLGAGYGAGINNSGQVVGSLDGSATVWTNGTAIALGASSGVAYSAANGINDSGIAVGYIATDNPYAVVFKGSTTIVLPAGFDGAFSANAINNSDVVIGTIFYGDQYAGGVWSAGCTTGTSACTLTALRGVGQRRNLAEFFDAAVGISKAGVVVGTTYWNGGFESGYTPTTIPTVWTNGNPSKLGYIAGSNNATAVAINDGGTIVGDSYLTKAYTSIATEWMGTTATALAMLPGTTQDSVSAINDAGLIVGSDGNVATLWENDKPVDLNTVLAAPLPAGVTLASAAAINEEGQILANGSNGQIYVLTPANAPEIDAGSSASALVLLLGSLMILRTARKQRQRS